MTKEKKEPVALIILDGFGYSANKKYNAIYTAKKPHIDTWFQNYPHTLLKASGTAVGLLPGQAGNSEVGHLTIGAGRIIVQDITRISEAIANGSFFTNASLLHAFSHLPSEKKLHFIGLLSDGGVHSLEKHLEALIKSAAEHNIKNVLVHALLDGRDAPPKSAALYLERLDKIFMHYKTGKLAGIHGRFYAMDRDHHWNRTEKSYRTLTEKKIVEFSNWRTALDYYYEKNIIDEFILPTSLSEKSNIEDGDAVLFFNVRPDRMRQLVAPFAEKNFSFFSIKKLTLSTLATMTCYDETFKTIVLFAPIKICNTLKEILAQHNKTIFSIAETEKYAHITYFFNGGQEKTLPYEIRILIPSLPLKNYVEHPAMSAEKITDAILHSLTHDCKDFYLINYANADIVGHSGDFDATVKAVECLDAQLEKLYQVLVKQMNGILFITADHGKAEEMFDEKSDQPKTAHAANPVPFIAIDHISASLIKKMSGLYDIAPLILQTMNLPVAKEMEKQSLINE